VPSRGLPVGHLCAVRRGQPNPSRSGTYPTSFGKGPRP
jgi:hypothetical protein